MIIVSKYLVPKGYNGIAVFPFVFLKRKSFRTNKVLLNHENIHLRQQIEMLIIPFYFIYVLEFIVRLLIYKNWKLAYRNISFEREAYKNEFDFQYLKRRPFWAFLKYLRSDEF